MCSTLVWGSNLVFSSAWFYFLFKCTTEVTQEKLNVDESSSVLQGFNLIFLMLLCDFTAKREEGQGDGVTVPILRKNCYPFTSFLFINTPF